MTKQMNNRGISRRPFASAALAVLVLALGAFPVWAQSFRDLRASGAIGERFDGYVEARAAGGQIAKVVAAVNEERRAVYGKRATQQGTSASAVGRVYAKQIMQKAPRGAYFRTEAGNWVQKK